VCHPWRVSLGAVPPPVTPLPKDYECRYIMKLKIGLTQSPSAGSDGILKCAIDLCDTL